MFTQHDATHSENLLKMLKRGKFELDGLEILAFAETYKWLANHSHKLKESVKQSQQHVEVIKSVKPAKIKKEKSEGKI